MAQSIVCTTEIVLVEAGPPAPATCIGADGVTQNAGWVVVDVPLPFDWSQVDLIIVSMMWWGGFVMFFTPWFASWGVGQVLRIFR